MGLSLFEMLAYCTFCLGDIGKDPPGGLYAVKWCVEGHDDGFAMW